MKKKFMNITQLNKSINVQEASTKYGSFNDSESMKKVASRALGSQPNITVKNPPVVEKVINPL